MIAIKLQKRNGVCLSTEYINTDTKMLWQCDKLHEPWEADFGHIQSRILVSISQAGTKYNWRWLKIWQ